MPEHHKVSLLLVGNQHRGLGMPQKYGNGANLLI